MPNQEEMTIDERLKYLRIMRKRYKQADRKERGVLLDEMEQVTEMDRKTLIRRMKGSLERKRRRKQRGRTYGPEVDDALRVISESLDHIAAERLTPNLVWIATHLAAHGELQSSAELLARLEQISVPTVRRILQRITQDEPRLPRKGPERANQLTRDIPMRVIPWDEQEPGHFEADLVHHSGATSAGVYVHTVQIIDVATGWSERVAVLGRAFLPMRDAFQRFLVRLPFPVLEIHPDNGSEFFNGHLLAFWGEKIQGLKLSRSRPFRSNDNRFVEQKNSTLVRAYLGEERLDTVEQCRALNALYERMWVYYNLFQPVMRLCEKASTIDENGLLHVKRRFDRAQTPFDRLCSTTAISADRRLELERLRERTNPRRLRLEIQDGLAQLFALPCAIPGTVENVLETLAIPLHE
jgi:hypothetical protein